MTEWKRGHISKVTSEKYVSVDGKPRHILDIRPVIVPGSVCPSGNSEEDSACEVFKGDGVGEVSGVSQFIEKGVHLKGLERI